MTQHSMTKDAQHARTPDKGVAVELVACIAVAGLAWGINQIVNSATIPATQVDEMNALAQTKVFEVEAESAAIATARRTVFIGDSYSQGTGASDKSKRWTSLVSKAQDWHEVNLALGGTGYLNTSTSGCGKPFCPNYVAMVQEAVGTNPGRVVVSGGQNDFSLNFSAVEPMINKTYADLRAALPNATIIAVGPSTIGDVTPRIAQFDAAVQRAASSIGAQYISLIDPDPIDKSMAAPDGVHVGDSGHAAIAATVLAKLGPPPQG